jgi:DNA repair photolyase
VLFPDWPPGPGLVGIARLAAESETLESKRRVDYLELAARSFIGRCSSKRVPFEWTINPYRGCEFGCKYCYARYTHEFMELRNPADFEQKIFAKKWNEAEFRAELKRIPREADIAIGTATDPYQPAERRYEIMRKMLEVAAGERGRKLWITTKSDLVARDADVLGRISQTNHIQVNMTITTVNEPMARLLEPYAPRPSLRVAAVRRLSEAGIRSGVLCCPLMPLINDSEASIEAVARTAADAGAISFYGNVLFLKPCSKQVFLPFVEQHFPALFRRYRHRFEKSAFLRGDYPEVIKKRVQSIRERYGLTGRSFQYEAEAFADEQMTLFDSSAGRDRSGDRAER